MLIDLAENPTGRRKSGEDQGGRRMSRPETASRPAESVSAPGARAPRRVSAKASPELRAKDETSAKQNGKKPKPTTSFS